MTPKKLAFVIVGVIVLGVAFYIVEDLVDRDHGETYEEPAASGPVALSPSEPSTSPGGPADGTVDAEQASAIALAEVPGSVVDVWPGEEGGRAVWYVDVRAEDGSMVEVYVDAATGDVLDIEGD